MPRILLLLLLLFTLNLPRAYAQISLGEGLDQIDYSNPRELEIGGITIKGVKSLDEGVLKSLTGLVIGERLFVPGEKLSKSVENLWKQGLLSEIKLVATRVSGDKIFLEYQLKERARLSRFRFEGVTKSEADKLREKLQLVKGRPVNENLITTIKNTVRDYFVDKGFLYVDVNVRAEADSGSGANNEMLTISVGNKKKIKINEIIIHDNQELSDAAIKKKMKGNKEYVFWKFFTNSHYDEKKFEEDRESVLAAYKSKGFRDARIKKDSIYPHDEKSVNLELWIEEGRKYYFRNINWSGNTKYTSAQLNQTLDIERGDVFNQSRLDEGLFMSQSGRDISSLYMDDGYLFFQVEPVEVMVEGDSIDYEMRIYEGKQARINQITVTGNTKTNDKVILREIRTKPGELFSRTDIIRTQRELGQLGYFDQEQLAVNPKPNPADGTVDIEYVVAERPSDQLELSGGYGGSQGIVGTLGISFNNFSAKNITNPKAWTPLPSGDGQKLSLRYQSNGRQFQSINASFTEPWLGGKKPNSLTVSLYSSIQTNGRSKDDVLRQELNIGGLSVGLGRRLKRPDDFFTLYNEASLQRYRLNKWTGSFIYDNGTSYNFNINTVFSRNSVDGFIWIRGGSQISMSLELTPPYSLLNDIDYSTASTNEKYKWIEYHKWKFNGQWYKSLGNKFVLYSRAQVGILGLYNPEVGYSPFERFFLGGDGLSGFSLDGREIIALRGYENNSITPASNGTGVGGVAYNKYTFELRFPVSLNPQATIYVLGFAEGGNNVSSIEKYNPFQLYRSAGAGVRIFLPMFGLLGLDWGYGFDEVRGLPNANGPQFHFSIGQQL